MNSIVSVLTFCVGVGCLAVDAWISRNLNRQTEALRAKAEALQQHADAQAEFHRKLMSYRDLLLDAKARMDLDRELDRLWSGS